MDYQATHPNATKQEAGEYLSGLKKGGDNLMQEGADEEARKNVKH